MYQIVDIVKIGIICVHLLACLVVTRCGRLTRESGDQFVVSPLSAPPLYCPEDSGHGGGGGVVDTRRQRRHAKKPGSVSGADPQLMNAFLKVSYEDDPRMKGSLRASLLLQDNHQRRQDHPFEHLVGDSEQHWGYSGTPQEPELILDNHKLSHRYRPRPTAAVASDLETYWPSKQPDKYNWPAQTAQRPESDSYYQAKPAAAPAYWPSNPENTDTYWPQVSSPALERPISLWSKPLKVTSPVSQFTTGSYGPGGVDSQVSDTISSKPVMVFDSLQGERVQNVKVIHNKVVVADRTQAHHLQSPPGKTNSNSNSNFQNTIVIPIVLQPSGQQEKYPVKPMNTFLQLPSVAEGDNNSSNNSSSNNNNNNNNINDFFTYNPSTISTTTFIVTPAPTTTTTTTTTTTEPTNTFIEVTVKPSTTTTRKPPTRRPKPTKKPPRKKPTSKPNRRPTLRPGGTLANLAVTPANDPGIQYVTPRPQTVNSIRPVSTNVQNLLGSGISPLGYSGLTGMTVMIKSVLGAMLIFLPSALFAAGIITSRGGIPLAKSDNSILFRHELGFTCDMDCLVQLVSELTGREPAFIRKMNDSSEMKNLIDSILALFKS